MTPGLLIFAATYVLIAAQRLPFLRLNRPAASLLGAVAMVVLGVLPLRDAYAAIDFDVLVFLLGLMLIVGYLEVGKFFEWAAEWILARARTPERLLLGVVVGGGLLSALFVNDTICLVVTPVLLAALGPLRVKPNPYLIGLAMGANVGSVVSVTGNPQNMLVGIWSGASFGGFLVHMLPVGIGGLAITYAYLRWAYRAELREPFRERLETVPVTLDRPLVLKALALFVDRGDRVARGRLPAARRDHRGCGDGGSCSAGPGLCDRPRRMVAAAVLRLVVRRHARFRTDRRSRLARRSRAASGAGQLALERGGGRQWRDGHPVKPDLERPGRHSVAPYRADYPQPGFDVARPRHELHLRGEPAPHRLDGESHRGRARPDPGRTRRVRRVRADRRAGYTLDTRVGDRPARGNGVGAPV